MMKTCERCGHPLSAHREGNCTIQFTDNFGPTRKCDCTQLSEVASEKDLERLAKIGGYVDLFSEYVSPVLMAAERSETPGEELVALSIALLTIAHISMQPLPEEVRTEVDTAAAAMFDMFYESVIESMH